MARSLVRWEPMGHLVPLRDAMDRMFDDAVFRPRLPFGPWTHGSLAIDVYETDGSVVVKSAIPGAKAEDIEVSVTGDTLKVKVESREEEGVRREDYLRRERHFGSFCRSVTLPGGLKTDEAEATLADGVLTLTFPKAEEVKPKAIQIKTNHK